MKNKYPEKSAVFSADFVNSARVTPKLLCQSDSVVAVADRTGIMTNTVVSGPRIDYNGNVPVGLLAWNPATNLCKDSYSTAQRSGMSLGTLSVKAPDGITDVLPFMELDQVLQEHYGSDFTLDLTAGTYIWSSCFRFVDGTDNRTIALRVAKSGGPVNLESRFKFIDGVWTRTDTNSVDTGIQNLGNGWGRAWIRYTLLTDETLYTNRTQIRITSEAKFIGDTRCGYYVWGRQLIKEQGPVPLLFATGSQLSTTGCTHVIPDVSPVSEEGTLFVEYVQPTNGVLRDIIGFSNNDASKALLISNDTTGAVRVLDVLTNTTITASGNIPKHGEIVKAAFSFGTGALTIAVNGSATFRNVSVSLLSDMMLRVGWCRNLGNTANTAIRKIKYYNSRMTQAELMALTR